MGSWYVVEVVIVFLLLIVSIFIPLVVSMHFIQKFRFELSLSLYLTLALFWVSIALSMLTLFREGLILSVVFLAIHLFLVRLAGRETPTVVEWRRIKVVSDKSNT